MLTYDLRKDRFMLYLEILIQQKQYEVVGRIMLFYIVISFD